MNRYSGSAFNLCIRAWFRFFSLLLVTFLVCLPAIAIPAQAQQWSQTGISAAPAFFTFNASGTGAAAAVDAFTGAAAPFNATRANGDPNIIAVFGTGLGADGTDADGNINASVQARIDGNAATVLYAGRAPGFVGLNQFNIVLPTGITSGTHTVGFAQWRSQQSRDNRNQIVVV